MIATLKARLGEKVSDDPAILESHGKDASYPRMIPPLAVVYAGSLEDVQETLAWCRENHIPLIPYGSGSSLEGQIIPHVPAITLDFSRMKRVLEIRAEDFLAVVEPGITREELEKELQDTGLFFPVDPGANASLGGMAATNASGTTTVRYGGMRQNVAELEVVLANGQVLRLGRSVRKTSSGYDLKDLFIGSGGTLGIITRLVLRLHPVPVFIHTMRVFFPGLEEAAHAAYRIMASALPVARLELLDELSLKFINQDLKQHYLEKPALFLEFHSSVAEAIEEESHLAEKLVKASGALNIHVARNAEERMTQWEARHQFYWAFVHCNPDRLYYTTDVAVPLSRVPELVGYAQELLREMHLEGSIVGHVGDGNFHTLVATLPEGYHLAEEYSARLVERSLALGGTATGEHGVGLVKKRFMEAEHGPALEWMRQIKVLFDPDGILNPGKML
ncbi:MAG TPA: FAD-binding oxidoreductase [Ktedonobacteraceae bacterium]|nr:FAD-binding oxidoreductase [Ktedonobacteraceae bacterium]